MLGFLGSLFDTGSFIPHGQRYLWNPAIIRLNMLSDFAIGSACLAISTTLAYAGRRARIDPLGNYLPR